MASIYPPGNGDTSAEELGLYGLAQQEARQRLAEGRARARSLNGSRAARQALGERMAALTRHNNADDRINGGRGGHARPPAPVTAGVYLPTYPPTY